MGKSLCLTIKQISIIHTMDSQAHHVVEDVGREPQPPSMFLNILPPEVRVLIYQRAFAQEELCLDHESQPSYRLDAGCRTLSDDVNQAPLYTSNESACGMLLVSRSCREEALPIFYGSVALRLRSEADKHDSDASRSVALDRRLLRNNLHCLHENIDLRNKEVGILDVFKQTRMRLEVFPKLKMYHLTVQRQPYQGISAYVRYDQAFPDDLTTEELVESATSQDVDNYGLEGFLRSDHLHREVSTYRGSPYVRFLDDAFAMAKAQQKFPPAEDCPVEVVVDMPLLVHGPLWQLWPGIEKAELDGGCSHSRGISPGFSLYDGGKLQEPYSKGVSRSYGRVSITRADNV